MIRIETKNSSVTVFPDKAQIYRTGNVKLEKGQETIELIGLPLTFETNRLQIDRQNAAMESRYAKRKICQS